MGTSGSIFLGTNGTLRGFKQAIQGYNWDI